MDTKKESSLQRNKVKPQEGFIGFQKVDEKDGFSRQRVEGAQVNRVSHGEEAILEGIVFKLQAGEDHQVKEQQSISG